jgi:hypothetical protein
MRVVAIVLFLLTFIWGVAVGSSIPEDSTFSRPWYEDGLIRVGDKVRYHPALNYADYYNSCTYIRVLSIKNVGNDRLSWLALQDCHFPSGYENVTTHVMDVLNLVKVREE